MKADSQWTQLSSVKLKKNFLEPTDVLTLFRMGNFGAAPGWGGPPEDLSHISYNDETWHSYTLPKDLKTI